ncbi:hypothetical protein Patl1_33593 [Pistacia atlantica]|uniref:Uncharacterized protein n=1 Tax=Pistacia atlantica TaxID=434234 RepID=A0ACC0ZUT6_9ROSI|nr:hypothetical protein Patl1_33593 [Pistacia atlantica]
MEDSGHFDDVNVVDVIQFHVQSGRGLNLHELACLAFCRMLDLAPFLLGAWHPAVVIDKEQGEKLIKCEISWLIVVKLLSCQSGETNPFYKAKSVLTYFKFAPPPFERFLIKRTVHELSVKVVSHYLNAIRTSYRLLIIEPEIFRKLWDWSCFLDLVKKFGNPNLSSDAELKKDIADIRWCGVQILSLTFRMSDRAISNFGVEAEEALSCLLRWEEFCCDTSLERAGSYINHLTAITWILVLVASFSIKKIVCSVLALIHYPHHSFMKLSHQPGVEDWDDKLDGNPFVLTSTVKRSFEVVLLAVSQKWPVLLYGPAGSGKSALINKLACESGNQVLSIHMDDQVDGKTLIGSYVCTEQPGEFRWQPGSLTQAILNGYWVVFEDIDKAPSDVQSILLPLLEGASSFITGHGEEIRVAESFRLFSTISTSKLDVSHGNEGGNSLGNVWRRVMIMPPSNDDLQNIVKAWYPNLESLADRLIGGDLERINSYPPHQVASLNRFSLRDLLKWCKRIAGFDFSSRLNGLSPYECQFIYQEAVDIFASFSTSAASRLTMMKELANMWAVPVSMAETLYPSHEPVIQKSPLELRIGRVILQCNESVGLHDQSRQFVNIRSSLHALERIACSVKYNEPVLLVGETGTGKTTLVQNMARMLGQRLTVLNLSQQSDVADLLGGFKPMDARFICTPLYKEFEYLFSKTFSRTIDLIDNLCCCILTSREMKQFFTRLQKILRDKDWKKLLKGLRKQIAASGMVFSFVEGAFVSALRKGEWILLDEVNLAPPETLQRIVGVLEGESGSLCLAERGDASHICRHPNFRIFACMNPATDAGKRDLPYAVGKSTPPPVPFDAFLVVNRELSESDEFLKNYILTKSVKEHLSNLARAIFIKRYPILLQGPTSSGKTSLVQYLAAITGHEFVRINNHEHTDLQEYLGSYITDASGKLVFYFMKEYWLRLSGMVIGLSLDELNLAPSDVLEALNRLLDDNRELFVPELCETIKAHPDFMLFATQNPPTFYGGRKMLSRAFRNRFVEIHVDEIPENELSMILEKRCQIPESYAKKMVEVMKDLQLHRQSSKVFAGKHGFITPRDLFRWATRFKAFGKSYEDLARDGYYLLAERLRDDGEKCVVQEVLEKHLRVRLVKEDLYQKEVAGSDSVSKRLGNVIWTTSMWRLYFLVKRCYELREPVLLVGETGGGKTTVCQLLSLVLGSKLRILNCHQYTETSDFIGGFYPVRDRSRLMSEFKYLIEQLRMSKALMKYPGETVPSAAVTPQDLDSLEQLISDLTQLYQRWQTIFMWHDGPLVEAMKEGSLFLVDEISLADDSVLERLNSVLEPERKLVGNPILGTCLWLRKEGPVLENITAQKNFFVLATMNPGGDYDELRNIALQSGSCQLQAGRALTVRDLLSWISFINVTETSLGPAYAFLHGVFLILLDGLSLGTGISKSDAGELRNRCLSFLLEQLKVEDNNALSAKLSTMENYGWGDIGTSVDISHNHDMQCDNVFGIDPFYIEKGHENTEIGGFEFLAPTTRRNALRVLRAMQLSKPVLLEGSPGVGKTSLIVALGKYSGHKVVRINLSEQTDIMDLLGSDLPVESDEGNEICMGLNAILDHRGEGGGRKGLPRSFLNRFTKVYVDELVEGDYLFICSSLYPSIPRSVLSKLILFNKRLHEETMVYHNFAQDGSPWEFNLRDVIRSCQIIKDMVLDLGAPAKIDTNFFLDILYIQRMRTASDRRYVLRLYEEVFVTACKLPHIVYDNNGYAFCNTMPFAIFGWLLLKLSENWKSIGNSLCLLVEIIQKLRLDLENNVLPLSWSSKDLDSTMKTILKLQDKQQTYSAKFEWVTGLLTKAIENGEWIVLENANLCNPTVLDRINSLVEPSGTITINECGTVDGKPVVLHPHPNFRMFLTINPSYGEVSRAMRNRGVEIYMMPPYWLFDEEKGSTFEDSELNDAKRFLALSGIPSTKLVESMAKAHVYATLKGLQFNKRITHLELARWVQLFQQLLVNGNQPLWSLQISWEHTYLSSLGGAEGENIISHAKNTFMSMIESSETGSSLGCSLCLPGGWPMPLKLRDLVWYSKEASVKQNCMYLEFLGAQYASCELQNRWNGSPVDQALSSSDSAVTYLMNVKMLQRIMFPMVSNGTISSSGGGQNLSQICWFNSQLHPYCQFFNSFLASLREELEDQIWKDIFCFHKEQSNLLRNAINCVDLLRLSYQQWKAEVLKMVVNSPSFDKLIQFYTDLLENHILFWSGVTSSQVDCLLISWRSLMKNATKLHNFCPKEVENVLMEGKNLGVSMSSHIACKSDEDDDNIAQKLEEICQMLVKRNWVKYLDLLESALSYSLTCSRRPPQAFVPHQKLLWMLDAWTSVDAVNLKVASFVLEMWFWWHSFLWSYSPAAFMNFAKIGNHDVPLPALLVQPVKTAVISQILQSIFAIKDYTVYSLKLKVASRNLWQSPPHPKNLPTSLLSVARSLFHQIIYAHKKSFDAGAFAEMNSMLCAFEKNTVTPLLRELFLHCFPSGDGFFSNLGYAWIRIGALRFHLLISCDVLDPAMKYSWKCSQLEEKILLLKLEIKVRQECEYLAGWSSSRAADKKRAVALQKLEAEHKRLQRKIVYRPNPLKFKALKKECDEFLELVNSSMNLVSNTAVMDLKQAIEQVCNWQATGFDLVTVNPKTRVPEYYFGDVDSSSNLFAIDISLLEKLVTFSRDVNTAKNGKELLSGEEITEKVETDDEFESLEDEWNLMQEYILNNMVQIHNQLFGSTDLVLRPGTFKISDADRLHTFSNSYTLGVEMLKGLGGLSSSTLDARLSPEHILRLCLEHEQKFVSSNHLACKYNFYKDSNAPVMAKMVKLLVSLQQRVLTLLSEWEDHPGLQKILDVVQMLLAIPLTTPLAKALSGLQILLNRAQMLLESGTKFPLSDLLEPITSLVCSWQKMEFESWPALLDEVQDQYESNAGKFGGIHSNVQHCPWQEEIQKILYNLYGFYVQFLPIIMEHIGANRKNIEKEVRELLKLCRWERFMPVDNLKRVRQKLRKLVQKYTELLQQPVMLILNRQTPQKGLKVLSVQGPMAPSEISDESLGLLNATLDLSQFNDEERSPWYSNWRKKVCHKLQNLVLEGTAELCFLDAKGVADSTRQLLASQSESLLHPEEWKDLWQTLEIICKTTMDCGNLWKDVNKSLGKRRAFSELLKLLENSGLHKHKFEIMKISNQSNWLFLQPSYDLEHLLLPRRRLSEAAGDYQCLPSGALDPEWKATNEFYFKSLASVQLLQHICLKHHEDFTSEQISRSISFLNHLIVIQQMQREAAYDFAKNVKQLRECTSGFGSLYSKCTELNQRIDNECAFPRGQKDMIKCIWQQKQLFDSLYSMLVEESLLLRKVESTHLNYCQSVRATAHNVLSFIDKFIPVIQKSKELLDNYLLGSGGAITLMTGSFHHFVIPKQTEQLVVKNFQVINEFQEHLSSLRQQDLGKSSVIQTLLSHFDDLLKKGKLIAEQFNSAMEAQNHSENPSEEASHCNGGSLSNDHVPSEKLFGSVTSWENILKSSVGSLSLDQLNDQLLEIVSCAEKMVEHSGKGSPGLSSRVGAHFCPLYTLLDLVLSFADGFLQDFLAMHKTDLAFPAKDQENDNSDDKSQDASGTGLGEGAGLKDVSDQITDEDQLLGASEKEAGDEQDASDQLPSKDDKGIEMEQDFAADTFSVSEDSGEEDNDEDGEDEQLESAMGDTGADSEVIDEKLWNKEEEENPNTEKEKHEPGPSVKDKDESNRELRAKEDSASMADELGELNSDEEAFADPTDLKLDESNENVDEDIDMDEKDGTENKEEVDPEEHDESAENGSHEEMNENPIDETMGEAENEQAGGTSEKDDVNRDSEENTETDLMAPRKDTFEAGMSDFIDDLVPNAESATQPNGDSRSSNLKNVAQEANFFNDNEISNDVAPLSSLPGNTSQMDIMVSGTSTSGKVTDDQPKTQLPEQKSSPVQKTQANPYRNVGDALEEWKERVNVSVDLQADNSETQVEVEDENADEYGYVSEFDKGTAQALGPATSEQIDMNVDGNEPDSDNLAAHRDDVTEMEIEKKIPEANSTEHHSTILRNKTEEQMQISDLEKSPMEGSPEGSHG